jgi:hypothetical protein
MGFLLFAVGHGLAIGGLALAALGYADEAGSGWIIALVAAGELTVLGSVFLLGDEGYQRLEARTSAFLRRRAQTETKSVSAQRHGFGIALLIVHLATYYLVWTVGILGYSRATDDNPFPTVFGLPSKSKGRR